MSLSADFVETRLPKPASPVRRRRYVAPAGTPVRLRDLASAAGRLFSGADPADALRAALSESLGTRHVHVLSTGRAGLTVILTALRELSDIGKRSVCDEVIIPSYTCFSVAASVVKAGLRPRLVDVDPATMDFDPDRLTRTDMSRVLAIVATNLYGNPSNLPLLASFAQAAGIALVDDAAQALGARIGNRASGTWGDVGLYSFDKGKNVSAIDGGAIVTDSDSLSRAIATRVAGLPRPPVAYTSAAVIKAVVYATFLRPELYWIPNGIPQLGLGATEYTTDFPLQSASRPLTALAATMIARLDEFGRQRRKSAAALKRRLENVAGVTLPLLLPDASPAALRFPFLAADASRKASLIAALNAAGIGATGSYPTAIADIPQLQGTLAGAATEAAGGRELAARIVTLPTHAYLTDGDVDTIGRVVERSLVESHVGPAIAGPRR